MVTPVLYYNVITTAWGQLVAVWSDTGLWELGFPRPDQEGAFADIRTKEFTKLEPEHEISLWSEQLEHELKLYLQGYPVTFSVPIDWRSYTTFQTEVLRYTADIPYGATVSYQQVAQAVGSPKAARAVGGAMHSNRTPIVVPCHRVVGSDGSLTGFGGGMDMKKALLLLENHKDC